MEPDDLYGLPLDEFTAERNALAKTRPEAKGLRKPTAAAYAINQLARRHALAAGRVPRGRRAAAARAAEGRRLPVARDEERQALAQLLQLAGEYAAAPQLDRVRQTLQAAAADEDAAALVRAGTLDARARARRASGRSSRPAPARSGAGGDRP